MFDTRKATQIDRAYKAKLEALQQEQRGLNKRVKVQRERSQQITAEFFATKDEWREKCGTDTIDWN